MVGRLVPLSVGRKVNEVCACGEKISRESEELTAASLMILVAKNSSDKMRAV